jgi:hypothetical protein
MSSLVTAPCPEALEAKPWICVRLALIIRPSGDSVRAFVDTAIGFHKIGEALVPRFRFSGEPQYARPFAPGLRRAIRG